MKTLAENIYCIRPSNAHRLLLLRPGGSYSTLAAIGHRRYRESWVDPGFEFYEKGLVPESLATCSSTFAIQENHTKFLDLGTEVELLPILVKAKRWFLANVLAEVFEFDEEHSVVMRSGPNSDIFYVQALFVKKDKIPDIFVLAGSNKSQIFVTEKMKAQLCVLPNPGVKFHHVGAAIYV
ncbi:hypothetical protein [Chitinolyticbacter albus]|uniref:hypothetical protein n=1 Tax=Chitinolyticbacter albus TaxID=2961951 RepID=UPI00210A0FF4|nr:hypothetical protein [Chitinolyticbacter albus]